MFSTRCPGESIGSHLRQKIVMAVPTAPPETCAEFEEIVDQTICLTTPRPFFGVGDACRDFSQTMNEQVRDFLQRADELIGK